MVGADGKIRRWGARERPRQSISIDSSSSSSSWGRSRRARELWDRVLDKVMVPLEEEEGGGQQQQQQQQQEQSEIERRRLSLLSVAAAEGEGEAELNKKRRRRRISLKKLGASLEGEKTRANEVQRSSRALLMHDGRGWQLGHRIVNLLID